MGGYAECPLVCFAPRQFGFSPRQSLRLFLEPLPLLEASVKRTLISRSRSRPVTSAERKPRSARARRVQRGTCLASFAVPVLGYMKRGKGILSALALLAGTMTMALPTAQAGATPPTTAETSCTGFQDDFAADYPGSLNPGLWEQAGAVASAMGQQLGTPLVAPKWDNLTPLGWMSQSTGVSALQSTGACSGPFTFSTIVEGGPASTISTSRSPLLT